MLDGGASVRDGASPGIKRSRHHEPNWGAARESRFSIRALLCCARACGSPTEYRENSLTRHGTRKTVGIPPLALTPFGRSGSGGGLAFIFKIFQSLRPVCSS